MTFVLHGGALEILFERQSTLGFELPSALATAYGGPFAIEPGGFFANFVSSVDGVVALEGSGESGHVISGDSAADHFVMGLLRASADAVVIGAGTLRASPKHLWTPARICPAATEGFAALRRALGLDEQPKLVVVTASGDVDPASSALRDAIVATTPDGERRLRGALDPSTRVVVSDSPRVALTPLVTLLRSEGFSRLLTEGGPSLVGTLLEEKLLRELFLTVSPRLFGQGPGGARKTLVHGVDLGGTALELLGVRRSASHLFLRYGVG